MARGQEFVTFISKEGENGAVRGKISSKMAAAMGAEDGDAIVWEVRNGVCIGGRTASPKEARALRSEHGAVPRASKAKPVVKAKAPVGKVKVKAGTPKVKVKAGKRKTSVDYDEPVRKAKVKVKKPKFRVK